MSTFRRYPQIIITHAPEADSGEGISTNDVRIMTRLGPMPFEMIEEPGDYSSILVQTFGANHELQVQYCHLRGWGVSQQCDRANIYGYHAGDDAPQDWEDDVSWTPVPVLGELAGVDRPVRFDVYASTERVYVFIEDKPAGCAMLPSEQMAEGPVRVVFGTAGYHIEIDEGVAPENAPHEFWQRHHLSHVARQFDNLGIDVGVAEPSWDESVLPCGTYWYGGDRPGSPGSVSTLPRLTFATSVFTGSELATIPPPSSRPQETAR